MDIDTLHRRGPRARPRVRWPFLLVSAVAVSCQAQGGGGLPGEGDGSDAELVGDAEQAISATPVRVENSSTRATLPTPDLPDDRGRLGFVTDDPQEPNGLYNVTGDNRWQRVGRDVYNVVDYGASPVDGTDDTKGIQAAVDAAASAEGGIIYFPRGEYDVTDSIVLPRSYTKPLVFQGDGRLVSVISTESAPPAMVLDATRPVIKFDPDSLTTSSYYGFRDLTIARTNGGSLLVHAQPGGSTPFHITRLRNAVFEHVQFFGMNDPGGAQAPTTEDLVVIEGASLGTFNDVVLQGGNTALVLRESSHVSLRDVMILGNDWSNHGIRLAGGGSHSIHHVRIDAPDGGTALAIEGGGAGIGDLQIEGLFGDGKRMQHFIKISGNSSAKVKEIVMKDINVPAPWGPEGGVSHPAYGIYMEGEVSHVRVLNSNFSQWGTNLISNGGRPIFINNRVKHVSIEHMLFRDTIEQNGLNNYVHIDPGAQRVRVELIDNLHHRAVREEGVMEDWSVLGNVAYVGASGVVRATVPGAIFSLKQGRWGAVQDTESQAGQQVILIGSAGGVILHSGAGNIQLTTPLFLLDSNCVMHLVYDGSRWKEVSRACH